MSSLPLPSWRLLFALALPVLAQQGLHFVVLMSDSFLAGHMKELSPDLLEGIAASSFQAAQTTAHYLAWFIGCYTVLVSVGAVAMVARAVGAGDWELANQTMHQAILLAIGLGAMGTVFAYSGGIEAMVGLLQLEGDAARAAAAYLKPLFTLLAALIIESAGISCLVGAGDTRTGLWIAIGVSIMNLPLTWGLCLGWGPLPRLGFVGISLGTALCHVGAAITVLTVLKRGRFGLKLQWHKFRFRWDVIRRILRISVPAAFDSLSTIVGQAWFLSLINGLGADASSAHGLALRWEALGYLSGVAFSTAATTLVGQNLGAGRPDQAKRAGWMAFAMGGGAMSFMGVILYTFAPGMMKLFCPSPEQQGIVDLGVPVLRLVAFAMLPLASCIIFTGALRGAGDTRIPVLFTWTGFFLIRIPAAYLLIYPESTILGYHIPGLGLGLYGAWLAMFADLFIRGLFFASRFAWGAWHRQRV